MSYSYSADEVKSLGIFRIAERKESYNDGGLDIQVTAHAINEGGGTLALFLDEDEANVYADNGHSLEAGSDIEVAILWPKGA